MISEFQQLSQKIDQLAQLTHTLRLENVELRQRLAVTSDDYAACQQRMRAAQERLAALIAHLPAPEAEEADDADDADDAATSDAEQEAA